MILKEVVMRSDENDVFLIVYNKSGEQRVISARMISRVAPDLLNANVVETFRDKTFKKIINVRIDW